MTFGKWILLAGILVTVAVVAIVVYIDMAPKPDKAERKAPNQLSRDFLLVLPEKVTDPQRKEIEGLLYNFYARAERGQVKIEDRITTDNNLRAVIERGAIDDKELARLMAEISHMTYKLDPEINPADSSGMHPLLIEDGADSDSR